MDVDDDDGDDNDMMKMKKAGCWRRGSQSHRPTAYGGRPTMLRQATSKETL
jgi:hypothetical protein